MKKLLMFAVEQAVAVVISHLLYKFLSELEERRNERNVADGAAKYLSDVPADDDNRWGRWS